MKKNIIIAILSVLVIVSIAFGLYQKTQAGKFEALAIENEKLAREAAIHAEKQMKLAEQQALLGVMALEKLQVALAELQNSKKPK